jgi:hypothetical protein
MVDWLMAAEGNHVLLLLNDSGLMQHIHALLEAGVGGSHGSAPIRDATEAALYKLVNHAGNFPPRSGIAVLTSQLSETDDVPPGAVPDLAKHLFFLYNHSSLVSLVQLPPRTAPHLYQGGENGGEDEKVKLARVMVRDATGKYAWDAVPAYAPFTSITPAHLLRRPSASHSAPGEGSVATQELSPPSPSSRSVPATATTASSGGVSDPATLASSAPADRPQRDTDKLHGLLQ